MKLTAKRVKKILLFTGLLLVLALVSVLKIMNSGIAAETVMVRKGDLTATVQDTGYVQPTTTYDLQAPQSGKVILAPVKVGQAVRKGQTVVVLENLDLTARITDINNQLSQNATAIAGAQASLDSIRLELQNALDYLAREQELYQSGAETEVNLQAARLKADTLQQSLTQQTQVLEGYQAQEAGLRQSLQNLNLQNRQLTLQSPVDGVILHLPAQQEQVVNPGASLATVANTGAGQLEIRADILSDDLGQVALGQPVQISAPVLGAKILTGRVTQIYPQAEEEQSALGITQRRVPVIIGLNDLANLKSGYQVTVAIAIETRHNVLVVPQETVITAQAGAKEVMAVVEQSIKYKSVKTGISDQANIEITAGLQAGDILIRDGSQGFKENTKLKGWWRKTNN
ncbi:MAG: efflux RND transporter periplasmic adaptor subunit [Firmicutes bacterium]|nr:efflux RND transporter periplasmic adaptor subunit [Bacillota bacterium]